MARDLKPITGRPKVGQRVLLRRMRGGTQREDQRYYWEEGVVEIVRAKEVVVRSRYRYEVTAPWGDLYQPVLGGYGGPIWKRWRKK